jgi:hypothetical protein
MLNDYLAQLDSPDSEQRKQAVIALGRLQDPAALQRLADVYHSDPDDAVRELAFKAGRYIRQSIDANGATMPSAAVSAPTERVVPPSDVQRAMGYLNQSLDAHIRNDDAKAIEALGRAFDINPNLRRDTMAMNLASELTGLPADEAVRYVGDPAARRGMKTKRAVRVPGDVVRGPEDEWSGALADIGLYGLVNGALLFVLVEIAGASTIQRLVNDLTINGGYTDIALPPNFNAATLLPLAVVGGLAYGLASILGLLFFAGLIHIIATTVLGGDGTMARLIQKTSVLYTIATPIQMLISVGPMLLSDDPRFINNVSSLSSIVGLGVALLLANVIGGVYQFGMSKGCLSMLLSTITLVFMGCACTTALTLALTQVFGSVNVYGP